jgi:flavin reductase (DIM6/NTAB) family NADH-FMN oxidoreductase RutF
MAVSPRQVRQLMGNFATGCTIVTMSGDPPHGMTANAVSSVSLDPPLVLICVDHETKSYEMLTEGGIDSFCINILTKDQQNLAEHFAGMNELDDSPFETQPVFTDETGAPIFEESLTYLDCIVHADHRAGDHTIYIGEVKGGETLQTDAEPLTFYQGGWGTVTLHE